MLDHNNKTASSRSGPPRILAYCHDGVGLGHLRRTLNICEHVGTSLGQASFLIATGSPYISLFSRVAGVDYLKLPSLRKVDNDRYVAKFLALSSSQILRCRESLLLETVRHYDPHVLLIDKAPLGVCGELVSTLHWLRRHRPKTRIIFGMRDIEDEATVTITQWARLGVQHMLEEYFDEVWVYGMRDVFDVAEEYRFSDAIKGKLHFMGYVTRRPCPHSEVERCIPQNGSNHKHVLVTVGGGTDGTAVLGTYLAKAAGIMSAGGVHSTIVAGPDLPPESACTLKSLAAKIPHVDWTDFVPCLSCRIQRSDAVVCMGGYNTLCEVVSNGRIPLVIPRTKPRLEQTMRANLWAARGMVRTLSADDLSADTLANQVMDMVSDTTEPTRGELNLRGLESVRERFGVLLNGGVSRATAVRV